MKNIVGKKIMVRVDGQSLKGIVKNILKDRVVMESKGDGKMFRISIPLNKISFFMEDIEESIEKSKTPDNVKEPKETDDKILAAMAKLKNMKEKQDNINVLACSNEKEKCPGVRYIRVGPKESITQIDYQDFTFSCPRKCDTCNIGLMSDVWNLSTEKLNDIFDKLLVGEYPKRKQMRKKNATRKKPSRKTNEKT